MKILALYTSTFLSVRVSQNFDELFENLSLFLSAAIHFVPLHFVPLLFVPCVKNRTKRMWDEINGKK